MAELVHFSVNQFKQAGNPKSRHNTKISKYSRNKQLANTLNTQNKYVFLMFISESKKALI